MGKSFPAIAAMPLLVAAPRGVSSGVSMDFFFSFGRVPVSIGVTDFDPGIGRSKDTCFLGLLGVASGAAAAPPVAVVTGGDSE